MKKYFDSKADAASYAVDLIWGLNPGCVLTITIDRVRSEVFSVTSVTEELSEDTPTQRSLKEPPNT